MPLAVFDVDGTLIDSNFIDAKCFLDAFQVEFGVDASVVDPAGFVHYTDRGIMTDLIRTFWARAADEEEIVRHRSRYLQHLERDASALAEIAGARTFLAELQQRGWRIALATGAWRQSALYKLRVAGFGERYPIASCDEFISREEIVRAAIALAGDGPSPIVLFGDGVWDVRCAANLHLPIVAVGRGAHAERLRNAGARVTIGDFADVDGVFAAIDEACSAA